MLSFADVPDGTKAWYAVSPLVNGQPMMQPPADPGHLDLDDPTPTVDAHYSWPSQSVHTCGITNGKVTFTFAEPFFELTEYEIQVGATVISGKAKKNPQPVEVPLPLKARRPQGDGQGEEL